MDSIAVTKPDMAVLSQQRLPISPFGALAQAFAQELLARAEQKEGAYSYVPLELLQEGEENVQPQRQAPVLQVDLHLILQALKEQPAKTEQIKSTQRIVERILEREKQHARKPAQTAHEPAAERTALYQNFYQILNQNIHLTGNRQVESGGERGAAPLHAAVPGQLGRQAAAFSRQLQTLDQDGRPVWMRLTKQSASQETQFRNDGLPAAPGERPVPMEPILHLEGEAGKTEERAGGDPSRMTRELTRAAEQALEQVLNRPEVSGRSGDQKAPKRQPQEEPVFPGLREKQFPPGKNAAHLPAEPAGVTGKAPGPEPGTAAELGVSPASAGAEKDASAENKGLGVTAREIRTGPMDGIVSVVREEKIERPAVSGVSGETVPPELTYRAPEGAEGQQAEKNAGVERKNLSATAREIRTGPVDGITSVLREEKAERPAVSGVSGEAVPPELTYRTSEGVEAEKTGAPKPGVSPASAVVEKDAKTEKNLVSTVREIRTGPVDGIASVSHEEKIERSAVPGISDESAPPDLTYRAPEGAEREKAGAAKPGVSPASSVTRMDARTEKKLTSTVREIRTGPVDGITPVVHEEKAERPAVSGVSGETAPPELTYHTPEGTEGEKAGMAKPGVSPASAVVEKDAKTEKNLTSTVREIRTGPVDGIASVLQKEKVERSAVPGVSGETVPPELTYRTPEGSEAEKAGAPKHGVSPASSAAEKDAKTEKNLVSTVREIRTVTVDGIASAVYEEKVERPVVPGVSGEAVPPELTYRVPEGAEAEKTGVPEPGISPAPTVMEKNSRSKKKNLPSTVREIRTVPVDGIASVSHEEKIERSAVPGSSGEPVPPELTYRTPEGAKAEKTGAPKPGVSPASAAAEKDARTEKNLISTVREIRTGPVDGVASVVREEKIERPTVPGISGEPVPPELTYRVPEGPEAEKTAAPKPGVSPASAAAEKDARTEKNLVTTVREIRTVPVDGITPVLREEKIERPTVPGISGEPVPPELAYRAPEGAEGEKAGAAKHGVGPASTAAEKDISTEKNLTSTVREIRTGPVDGVASVVREEKIERPTVPGISGETVPPELTYRTLEGSEAGKAAALKSGVSPASVAAEKDAKTEKKLTSTVREIRTVPVDGIASAAHEEKVERSGVPGVSGEAVPPELTYRVPEGTEGEKGATPKPGVGPVSAAAEKDIRTEKNLTSTVRKIRTGPVDGIASVVHEEKAERSAVPGVSGETVPPELTYRAPEGGEVEKTGAAKPGVSSASATAEKDARTEKNLTSTVREIRTVSVDGIASVLQKEKVERSAVPGVSGDTVPPELTYRTPEGVEVEKTSAAKPSVNPVAAAAEKDARTEKNLTSTAREIRTGPVDGITSGLREKKIERLAVPGVSGESVPPELTYRAPEGAEGEKGAAAKPGVNPVSAEEKNVSAERKNLSTTAREIRTGPVNGITPVLHEEKVEQPVAFGVSSQSAPPELTYLDREKEPFPSGGLHTGLSARLGQAVFSGGMVTGSGESRNPAAPGLGPRAETGSAQRGAANGKWNDRQPAARMAGPDPVKLTYGRAQRESTPPQEEPGRVQPAVESEYVRSLPDWARKFLRESSGQRSAERDMVVAQQIATLPQQEEQVQWTAPNYRPPASITYREKGEKPAPVNQQEPAISDAEIQRTADRVYRIIEERIRRERRRLGF